MFWIIWLKLVIVVQISKGQIIDHFSGNMPTAKETERMRNHRVVHFRSAQFGYTWTDCLCPFNPCRSLLLIFISSSTRRFANSPGRVSAEGQLIYINFFHQSNSIQLLVSLVIDSSHSRVTRRNFTPTFPQNRAWKSPFTRLFKLCYLCNEPLHPNSSAILKQLNVTPHRCHSSSHCWLCLTTMYELARPFAPLHFCNFITTTIWSATIASYYSCMPASFSQLTGRQWLLLFQKLPFMVFLPPLPRMPRKQ
jgi:hypothetical protein